LELVEKFRARYPEGSVPAYITRSPDKSMTPLRWRVSPAYPKGARPRIEITGPQGEVILRRLPAKDGRAWLEFEWRRLEVNLALSTASYELARLRASLLLTGDGFNPEGELRYEEDIPYTQSSTAHGADRLRTTADISDLRRLGINPLIGTKNSLEVFFAPLISLSVAFPQVKATHG
jgi:hypothetical protein